MNADSGPRDVALSDSTIECRASANAPLAPTSRVPEPQFVPTSAAAAVDPFEAELLTAMAQATTLQAHEAYLAFSEGVFKTLSEAVQAQLDLVARATGIGNDVGAGRLLSTHTSQPAYEEIALNRSAAVSQTSRSASGRPNRLRVVLRTHPRSEGAAFGKPQRGLSPQPKVAESPRLSWV